MWFGISLVVVLCLSCVAAVKICTRSAHKDRAARLALDERRLVHEEAASKRTHSLEREKMNSQMTIESMKLMLESQLSDPRMVGTISATVMVSMLPESDRPAALERLLPERQTYVATRPLICPMTPSTQFEDQAWDDKFDRSAQEPVSTSSGQQH